MGSAIGGVVVAFGLGLGAPPALAAGPSGATDALPHLRNLGSARVVRHITTTTDGKPVVLRSAGAIDFRHGRRHEETRPRGVYPTEERQIGPDLYVRGAPHTRTPTGRPWQHYRDDFVPDQAIQDPAELLRGFRPYRPNVRRMDRRAVRGVATTHYRLTSTVPVAPKLRAAGFTGPSGHTDVWIDALGHVRRLRVHVAGLGGSPASTTVTDYFDLGVAVHVDRPPAKTVNPDPSGASHEQATGPPQTVASGVADGIPWAVRFVPTHRGACSNLASDGRPQPYGVRIRNTKLLGSPCGSSGVGSQPSLQFTLLRNGAQIISGTVPNGTATVTVRYDDGSTTDLVPQHGGIAFAIVGDRIATEVVPHVPGTTWSCALDASFNQYRCSGGGTVPPPNGFGSSPTTAPGPGNP